MLSKLTRDTRLLLVFSAMRNITDLFLGTFLVSFIVHIAPTQIISVGMYRLFEYLALIAGYFLIANLCKRYNKTFVFALNEVPKITLLLVLVWLGNGAVDFIIPLGILYGIGEAMYHLPMSTMISEKTNATTIKFYMGAKTSINYTIRLVVPVVFGFFIDTGSFVQVANILLILSVLELGLCFLLTPSRHRCKRPFDIVGFVRCMMRFPVIRRLFLMELSRGFGVSMLGTVVTMYTIYMFKTDLNLGILTTIFSVFSIVASWVLGRYVRVQNYVRVLVVCLVMIAVGMGLFVFCATPITFLLYNFIYAVPVALLDQICGFNTYRLSNSRCVTSDYRVEYLVFRELLLFLGRWISCVVLLYIGVFGGYYWLRWYLCFVGVATVLTCVFAMRLLPRKTHACC